jgi:hypothetical protein
MAPDDSQARRRLLFERAHANLQRRRREATLSKLPPELAAVLLSRPCIYSPEADRVIRQMLPISPHGIGGGSKPPPGYSFTEVSRQVAALAAVENLGKPDSQMAGLSAFPYPISPISSGRAILGARSASIRCELPLGTLESGTTVAIL